MLPLVFERLCYALSDGNSLLIRVRCGAAGASIFLLGHKAEDALFRVTSSAASRCASNRGRALSKSLLCL